MLRLLRSEIFRLRRRWMPWILLFAIAVVPFLVYTLIYVSISAQREAARSGAIPEKPEETQALAEALASLRPAEIPDFGIGIVIGLGSVMLIVLAASHVGAEFGWGTLRTLLAHGAGRAAFLAAKLASLALYATLFVIVGTIAAIAASYVISGFAGLATTPGVDLTETAGRAMRGLYTILPYMALASLIAVWSRSGGAGIAAGLVIFFSEGLVSQLVASLNRDLAKVVDYGLGRNVDAVQRAGVVLEGREAAAAAAAAPLPDALQATIVLACWTTLFVALAYWRLRARDVTLS